MWRLSDNIALNCSQIIWGGMREILIVKTDVYGSDGLYGIDAPVKSTS